MADKNKIIGSTAMITRENCLSTGLVGKVISYDKELKKYRIEFGRQWVGWFKAKSLKIIISNDEL